MTLPLKDLLSKYDKPGPRYTSYPTAPAWTEQVGSDDYASSLQSLKPGESLSLYFHLPFCERLCHFCGCMKVITTERSRSRDYVNVLLKEIKRVSQALPSGTRDVSQLHFGGGTPNFLQPNELSDIMAAVRQHFQLLPDAEIAIEMHPRTSTPEFCDNLKQEGFNRVSLGVQDFNPKVQKLINRNQSYEMTVEMLNHLKKIGFSAFNFDLIYGLPGQELSTWQETLKQVIELKPNRMAVYSYAHVPWIAPVQRSFKDSDLPSPELKLELFEQAYQAFTQQGYQLIGMDHFALADDELSQAFANQTIHRNFMGYSTRADAHQLGFGVSAISYAGGNYFQNRKQLDDYCETVNEGKLASFRGFLLDRDDAIRRDFITRIMCCGAVDLKEFGQTWDIDVGEYFVGGLRDLSQFVDDEMLELSEDKLQVINDGFLFLRNMAMCFDSYLEGIQRDAKNPTFSRTV